MSLYLNYPYMADESRPKSGKDFSGANTNRNPAFRKDANGSCWDKLGSNTTNPRRECAGGKFPNGKEKDSNEAKL